MSRDGYFKTEYAEPIIEGLSTEPVEFHGSMHQRTDGSYIATAYGLTDTIKLLNGAPLWLE